MATNRRNAQPEEEQQGETELVIICDSSAKSEMIFRGNANPLRVGTHLNRTEILKSLLAYLDVSPSVTIIVY
jgi:hypothetical protein